MLYAVIMAGGSGTRFWPQSRRTRPKQLLKINGDKTMIRATVERVLPDISFEHIMVVTGGAHCEEIKSQIPELDERMIVAEPQGRNTAPCIALAAYRIAREDPDAVMVVLPADHLIGKEDEFRTAIRAGAEAASTGDYLITFGIVPDRPETGYGYIELGPEALKVAHTSVFQVQAFVEKPDRTTAEKYLTAGTYLWNSGMFVWKVSAIIEAFEKYSPSVNHSIKAIAPYFNTPREPEAIREAYASVESISIDYAIMEKAANVLVLPIDVEWNDVGSWASLHDVWVKDGNKNAVRGAFLGLDTAGCVVSSPHKLTTLIGVDDLIVVDTPDAILVCRKDRAQDVRNLQETLKKLGYEKLL
ncbi:MAG: mannose-1-phosphate guanylyltransferase [Desulfomonilaceae bacterium]